MTLLKKKMSKRMKRKLESLACTIDAEISDNLDENEKLLMQQFSDCADFTVRKMHIFDSIPCILVYLQVLVDGNHLDEALLKSLIKTGTSENNSTFGLIERLENEFVSIAQVNTVVDWNDIFQRITRGEIILIVESSKQAISLSVRTGGLDRALEEPATESMIRGPRVGFIENINKNMGLVRRLIRSPQLKMERFAVGKISQTDVVITYIKNIASDKVIGEVRKRISQIDMDSVLESGYIEEMIRDERYSPFPTMQMTERPDSVAANLLEGKVAILTDGSPMALIVPITFWRGFQSGEDYYSNYIFVTMIRWLRYLFAAIALLLPSFFIAVTTFHQESIPTSLALSIAGAREVVPFPALVEIMIMEITFEALREAGIRLPRPVGQTVSIVGALVIGQAAVEAGIMSAPIIIVVAFTGIAAFLIPDSNMSQAVRILRFPIILLAGSFGLYGIGIAMTAILIHLVNLRSFGEYYMAPLAPFQPAGLMDALVRAPWWVMSKRKQTQDRELEKP